MVNEKVIVAGFGGQTPGPNQVLVQGGRAVLGTYEEDVFYNELDLLQQLGFTLKPPIVE